ncbi:MAG: amylo-alpha-1,6-glucosidase [Verrucomicrobiota bacterium]
MNYLPIDIHHVSFSRKGAYLCITGRDEAQCRANPHLHIRPGLWLRNFHDEGRRDVFFIEPIINGNPADYSVAMTPDQLTLTTDKGTVKFCLSAAQTLRIRSDGPGLRLSMEAGLSGGEIPMWKNTWRINAGGAMHDYTVCGLKGNVNVGQEKIGDKNYVAINLSPAKNGQTAECALIQSKGQPEIPASWPAYETVRQAVQDDFEAFHRKNAHVPSGLADTAYLATYINWSSFLSPCAHMTRDGMLMSKNWMGNIWSWDHCFNGIGLAEVDPEAAWDQFMVIFDHQLDTGQIPDMINDTTLQYNSLKPPNHGWAYDFMMRLNDEFKTPERMATAYECLSRWTNWWFNHRDPRGTGLPEYHHGNDSGWDNGTVFDIGVPVQGPDLAAFLVQQMDVLADLAERLGRSEDANAWRERCQPLVDTLLDKLWTGDRFVTRHALTGNVNKESRALINCIPIVIADRLPCEVRNAVLNQIREHLTDWGLATEHPDSTLYTPDGYWRGPIWPSPTFILIDTLRTAGETELANTVADRFVKMCVKSGFSENYNALTGEALRDQSYTWASSLFLLLAREQT